MAGSSGQVSELDSGRGTTSARLSQFAVNSDVLLEGHRIWLNDMISPLLRGGGSVSLIGLASRTGSDSHNLALSKRRATAVLAFLRLCTGRSFNHLFSTGTGEAMAALAGQADGTEDGTHRAVLVIAWAEAKPPPQAPRPMPQRAERVISRSASKLTWPSVDRGTVHDGSFGESIASIFGPGPKETRSTASYPADYAVNEIHEVKQLEETYSAAGRTLRESIEVRYTWGPMSGTVLWDNRYDHSINGKKSARSRHHRQRLPRRTVFKRATTPNKSLPL